jgi:hypothetical protein
MPARTTAVASFAIFFIFDVGCCWRGAVANGGFWGGCVDNGSSCGLVLKLSNRFFGALAGARFFFGFRPRLLGIGKQRVGTDQVVRSPETIGSTCRNTATPDCFSGSSRSCVEHADAPHPSDCCARATPPSATSNSRRPMVTVIRPSRARCVKRLWPRPTFAPGDSPGSPVRIQCQCAKHSPTPVSARER